MAATKKPAPAVKKYDPLLEARKVAASAVLEPNVEPRTAYLNVKAGLANLRNAQHAIANRIIGWDGSQLARAAALNEAFYKTALAVADAEPKVDTELAKDTETAWALRRLLLAQAQALALAELMPGADVAAIAKGTGLIDCAADCAALAKLFKKHADAIAKKTFVTAAQLTQASEVAARLLRKVKPKSAKLTPSELVKARDLRNRLYTLLKQNHDELWGVAALTFGRGMLNTQFPEVNAVVHVAPKAPAAPAVKETPAAPELATPAEPAKND